MSPARASDLLCFCNRGKLFGVSNTVQSPGETWRGIPLLEIPGVFARVCWTLAFGLGGLLVFQAHAEVRVFIQNTNGVAWLKYECTGGEIVRAFALNVSVDRGQITGISDFFRGESKPGATGYGIFPASFRDHLQFSSATNFDWNAGDYTPLADVADNASDTLPGLNSSGVTLEFGGLWDPTVSAALPGPTGTLCALQLSQPANISVSANVSRGGVVDAYLETTIQPVFLGGPIGPSVTSARLENGVMTILFQGGELQTAGTVLGPWADTGNFSGTYSEPVGTNKMQFYRVHIP